MTLSIKFKSLPLELLSSIFVHLEKLDANLYSYMTKKDKIRFLNNVSFIDIVDNIDACIDYKNLLPEKFKKINFHGGLSVWGKYRWTRVLLSDEFMMTFSYELFETCNLRQHKYLRFKSLKFIDFFIDKYSYTKFIEYFYHYISKDQFRYTIDKFKNSYKKNLLESAKKIGMNYNSFTRIPRNSLTYNDIENVTDYKLWYALSARNGMLTIDMIEKYSDKICWDSIAACYKLPLCFISKYLHKMCNYIVLHSQKLPLEFIINNFTFNEIQDNFCNFSRKKKKDINRYFGCYLC